MSAIMSADLDPRQPPDRGLAGARVGLLEGRMGRELAELVRRHQGIALGAPALKEIPIDATKVVGAVIDRMAAGTIDMIVFLTGAGVVTLFEEAERIGRLGELEEALRRVTIVCRGHKPRAALKQRGLPTSVTVAAPYTTVDVINTLATLSPEGRGVAVIHYGERSAEIGDALRAWGSRVLDVCVYEWALPDDTGPLERLIAEIVAGRMDAVAFTSQVQVRHLLAVADWTGGAAALIGALNNRTVVAAVGPTCAEALRVAGVTPRVVPAHPKMGAMVVALGEYLRTQRGNASDPAE